MKISKRQLRRIIKEEKAKVLAEQPVSGLEGEVYDDTHEQVLRVVEDILNAYGDEPDVSAGLSGALQDIANMVKTDDRIMGVRR